jgi:hypothetical protein
VGLVGALAGLVMLPLAASADDGENAAGTEALAPTVTLQGGEESILGFDQVLPAVEPLIAAIFRWIHRNDQPPPPEEEIIEEIITEGPIPVPEVDD